MLLVQVRNKITQAIQAIQANRKHILKDFRMDLKRDPEGGISFLDACDELLAGFIYDRAHAS